MFRNFKLTRNQKIDLAAGLMTGSSLAYQAAYAPSPTALLNAIRACTTVGWGIIGAEVVKRIVNGPQDSRVTTVVTDEDKA